MAVKVNIPDNIEKIERSEFLTFLDTTPSSSATWKILGIGVTDFGIDYGASVDSEKWIIENTARINHSSNEKQGSVTQTAYKNDPLFEFVNAGRDKLNYKTHILDIDVWNGNGSSYPAKKSDGKIVIENYMGENAAIEYTIHYEGDPVEGTVTFADGVPTFTPTTSL